MVKPSGPWALSIARSLRHLNTSSSSKLHRKLTFSSIEMAGQFGKFLDQRLFMASLTSLVSSLND